ncbi:MAG TPA: hypothetical protein VG711_01040 [Phycisphaerales bacterium]|nr:hypothetical protein [Phycisphaerales bacterium]
MGAIMANDFINVLTQFGAAGLIGWLWIAERRQNAKREQELTEAHQQIKKQDRDIESLLTVIKENTRAIKVLEMTQRHLAEMVKGIHFLSR